MDFREQYRMLLLDVLSPDYSVEETNERTGHKVRVLHGGQSLLIDLRTGHLPVPDMRKVHPKTAAAEIAWFIQGTQDVTWLMKYAKIWAKFVEADGKTIDAGYGYRWKKHFGRDQLWLACKALFEDPSDRRVYISTWDPSADGLGAKGQRNVPCPVGFSLSLVGGLLNSTMTIRSSDVFVGLPYDVMGHAILMEVLATTIGPARCKGLGFLQVALAHPHIYDSHYEMAREAVNSPFAGTRMKLLSATLNEVESDPDRFVLAYGAEAKGHTWPTFNPLPEVVA